MMKRLLAFILALILSMMLTGCKQESPEEDLARKNKELTKKMEQMKSKSDQDMKQLQDDANALKKLIDGN